MSSDGAMPHKFPDISGVDHGDIIAWTCQACGAGINEYSSKKRTECTVDWRGEGR